MILKEDGVDHINIWSRAQTQLGRDLSNFAHLPFAVPGYGDFDSMEGYWYWVKTGMQYNALRHLSGFAAKKVGKQLAVIPMDETRFRELITKGIYWKLQCHYFLRSALAWSTLPLTHYYAYGTPPNERRNYPESGLFQVIYLEDYREQLKASLKQR